MLNIDFYNMFININFDTILADVNNPLVNSKELYLNYKNKYFEQTHKNYSCFLRYNAELQKLKESQYTINTTKYHFVYLDQKRLEKLKNDLKIIILKQNTLFNNFKHYVETLNKDKDLFSQNDNTQKPRGLFSLFNKSKKTTQQAITLPPGTLKRSKSNASTKSTRSVKSIQSFKSFME